MYMNISLLVFAVILLPQIRCCDDYLECIGDLLHNFFINDGGKIKNVEIKNITKDFDQVTDLKVSELDQILSDVHSLLSDEIKTKQDSVIKHVNNKTKIYVKTFSVDKKVGKLVKEDDSPGENKTDKIVNKTNPVNTIVPDNLQVRVIEKPLKNIKDNEIIDIDGEFDKIYYDEDEDNSTDYPIIDYIDLYKDTTNEDNYIPTEIPTSTDVNEINNEILKQSRQIDTVIQYNLDMINDEIENGGNYTHSCHSNGTTDVSEAVFPWIATIFVKNDSASNQFDYFCDGAVLSEKIILTAARCVNFSNSVLDAENLLVILGKRSLQAVHENERVIKIQEVITHENFTVKDGTAENDLAVLVMESPVTFSDSIQAACVTEPNDTSGESLTTAWDFSGQIQPIYFVAEENTGSGKTAEETFCATYGNDVALCPSYGGLYAKRTDSRWYLQGIRTGDTAVRGICFDKTAIYTSLRNYSEWIQNIIEYNKE